MRQKQLGNTMVQKLLEALQACPKLEQVQCSTGAGAGQYIGAQVILMDPSQSPLTSRVFPATQALELLQARTSMRLLYITSPLLTQQSAKKLKAEIKALKRKHLLYSLHPPGP